MKFKTTKKEIKNNYSIILAASYCSLQHLLETSNPIAYSAGGYGWDCDYYELEVDNMRVLISTGYRPIGEHINYDLCKEYDDKARDLKHNRASGSWDEYRKAIKPLLNEFLKKAVQQ